MDIKDLLNTEDDELLLLIKELKDGIVETKKYLLTHNLTKEQLVKAKAISVLFIDKTIEEIIEYQDIFPLDESENKLLSLFKEVKQEIEQLYDSYISK